MCQRLLGLVMLAWVAWPAAAQGAEFQGFGAATRAGNDGQLVEVTSLDDSGPGTLRAALAAGNRRIVFRVGGTIDLNDALVVTHSSITLDGRQAPAPGVTIRGHPFVLQNARDVIVRNLRFRESGNDNVRIVGQCRNIVVDHCSSTRAGDGAIDITLDYKTGQRPRDITICWCLIAGTEKAALIQSVSNLSMHHNLFINNSQRNPQLHDVQSFDLRNNAVWYWLAHGIRVRAGSAGNLVDNLLGPSMNPKKRIEAALLHDYAPDADPQPAVYLRGNVAPEPFDPNTLTTTTREHPAPGVDTVAAARLMQTLLQDVGARPLDDVDREYLQGQADLGYRPAR